MRKFVLLLLIAAMVIVGDSYAAEPVIVSKNDRAVVQMKNAALLSPFVKCTIPGEEIKTIVEFAQPPAENEPKAKPVVEQSHYCDSIPLTSEEQEIGRASCRERV